MDWIQVLTIVGMIAGICWGMFSRLDSKFENLTKEIHHWNMGFQERLTRLETKKEIEEKK